jgi:cytochrome c-type biogenesis protein CcsB
MAPLEAIFVWTTLFVFAITSALYIYAFVFKNTRVLSLMGYLIAVSFFTLTAAIVARYAAVGNLPVSSDYENGMVGAWFVVLITLYAVIRHKALRAIGVATLPFSLILLGYGVMREPVLQPLAVSAKSFWLYIHVFFAWLAFGAFAVTAGMGTVYLLKEKKPEKEFYQKFPDLKRLDDLMFKYLIFGFITDAVMIASGAIWAKDLWGSYWSWDPVETWSLVTWVIYGLAVHLRVTMGWRGRKFAWIAISALLGMVITYFGINFVLAKSLHYFKAWQEI